MPESTEPAVTPPDPRRRKRGERAFAVEIKVETGARAEALEQEQTAVLFEIARYFAAQQAALDSAGGVTRHGEATDGHPHAGR